MTSFTAIMFQSRYASAPHPVFAIDGISLDVWLSSSCAAENLLDLVPAQGWLIDDQELKWAWERIESLDAGVSTIVPILVCSDDVDLSCTVVVAEQVASEESVSWQRFGFSRTSGSLTGVSTQWFSEIPPLTFRRDEFSSALASFKSLAGSSWK